MNKSEKLKNAILENYKSIREFSKVVNIPNSTIVSAIDNGIGGMAVDKVIKICEALHLDVKTFDKAPISKYDLTNEETNLINVFNKLNNIGKSEAIKRITELTLIDKYTIKETKLHLLPNAAHEIEGASEEDKAHDDAIMDDNDF